jgi:hypothetical protein
LDVSSLPPSSFSLSLFSMVQGLLSVHRTCDAKSPRSPWFLNVPLLWEPTSDSKSPMLLRPYLYISLMKDRDLSAYFPIRGQWSPCSSCYENNIFPTLFQKHYVQIINFKMVYFLGQVPSVLEGIGGAFRTGIWRDKRSQIRQSEELSHDAAITEASANPLESSETGMIIQSCPKLRQGRWTFMSHPSPSMWLPSRKWM